MNTKPSYILHHISPPSLSAVAAGKHAHLAPDFAAPEIPDHDNPDPNSIFLTALSIRKAVFANEQHCSPTIEVDADDAYSDHWVIFSSLSSSTALLPAGTVRLVSANPLGETLPSPFTPEDEAAMVKEIADSPGWTDLDLSKSKLWDQKEPYVMIGRMANTKEFRGRGYGKVLIDAAIEYARQHPQEFVRGNAGREGGLKWKGLVTAHAQEDVLKFYERCGFSLDEGVPIWFEEGIRHVAVWKRVDVP